jgi:hypothetical protein
MSDTNIEWDVHFVISGYYRVGGMIDDAARELINSRIQAVIHEVEASLGVSVQDDEYVTDIVQA